MDDVWWWSQHAGGNERETEVSWKQHISCPLRPAVLFSNYEQISSAIYTFLTTVGETDFL